MSYLENDTMPPIIQIDSVAIGLQLNDDLEAKNLNTLDLRRKEEFLVVGEKTYTLNDTLNTKWNFVVNDNGVAINTSRALANKYLTSDTSLFVDKNIHCSGIIKAAGLQISNIIIDEANPINSNLVKQFIDKANQLLGTQPFKISSHDTNFENIYNHEYKITNIYTPCYVTFGGEVDTYNNTHPLNIVTTPNNKYENMHISIRNDTNNDEGEPIKMCMGIIGGFKESPAIISTSKGTPLEFHVSKSSIDIESPYGDNAYPTYSNVSNIPAMTIDANNNVGIGTNIASTYNYQKKSLYNNKTSGEYFENRAKFDVKGGIVAFEDVLIKDYETGIYKHTDDIYIRNTGVGALNATQINGGDFTDQHYNFNNNLSVSNLFNAKNVIIQSNIDIKYNTKTDSLNVENQSVFNGNVIFNNNVDFTNTNVLNINNLNVNLDIQNDIFINNKKIVPIDLTDPYTGYTDLISKNGSNFIFMYISSNIAYLDANSNVSFPNKMGLGLNSRDKFDAVLNIVKNDYASTSNSFDILLKEKINDDEYIANIGRLSRLDYIDKSLIINTNAVSGKKNNIYFYPETDVKSFSSNYFLDNIKNTFPTLAILKGSVGINKLIPDSNLALDVNGNISANEYYVYYGNNYSKTKSFVYNRDKDFYNIYDRACDKFCINYKESREEAHNMKGLNVKKGINSDFYYQNNILLENLKRTNNDSSFYTNKNISIGWRGEESVAPLQIRNLYTNNYNYSTIRIYRGVTGGGKYNNADYSGIDICEYERDINSDRNKERWFIYKNHRYNDVDSRDVKRIGPLQIGYTNKTIEPTSYGMSFYYDTVKSKYHIDVNNPKVSYNDDSAMTIYGDLSVHGNINILDNYGCNFNFNFKGITAQLEKVDKYVDKYFNYISCNILNNAYNNSQNKIITSFDIFRPRDNIIIDCINNNEIPLIVKNVNNDNDDETEEWKPVTKFITYSKRDISYSSIELSIYNSNNYYFNDADDIAGDNIKGSIEISTCYNSNNTILDFNVFNSGSHKNFLKFVNNTDGNGDIINTVAHLGIGNSVNSNILLHVDGNATYGLQITNRSFPASINLVNSEEGNDVYHSISGGDVNNNNTFTINVASKSYSEYNPTLTSVFSIDAFDNYKLRKGARFGFNDTRLNEEINGNKASVVINSEYDNSATAITNRYTYDFIYESSVNIAYSNIYFTSNLDWNNDSKIFNSSTMQNISILPDIDENDIEINIANSSRNDFIVNKKNILTSRLFYTTIHENIEYENYYSNLEISCANYEYELVQDIQVENSIYTNRHSNNLFDIVPRKMTDIYNDLIVEEDTLEKIEVNITSDISHTLSDRNLEFNYSYYNQYKKSLEIDIDYDIAITSVLTHDIIFDSNYINVSNSIITKLLPFDDNNLVFDKIYTELNEKKIDIDNDIENSPYIEYSNLYLRTFTKNIVRYNSNINYPEKYYLIHSNYIDINSSNTFIEKLFNTEAALYVSSNIVGNNIFIKTSNYSINPLVDSLNPYDTELKLLSSNVYIDSFNILGYTCNNTLVIEEYVNDYSNIDFENFVIGIRNYNKTKYHPHISLINTIENDDNISCNIHEIYSYDGIFEINYIDDANNDFTALKIDRNRNLFIDGGIKTRGSIDVERDIKISGNIYDANGNNLLEILNQNNYQKYDIKASNIVFNYYGNNGIEINTTSSDTYDNYKFLYIKDYIYPDIINDVLVLYKSTVLDESTYNLDIYTNLYVYSNLHIDGYGDDISLSVEQQGTGNIISASNLTREVFTLANDGSLGLGIEDPRSVLLNMKQMNMSNIISASNINSEVLTLTYDGILGIGVSQPNKESKLDVRGNINIVDDNSGGLESYRYTINNRDIIRDTCNYVDLTSNIISERITALSADNIANGVRNKFIIDDNYDDDLYINGNLVASNLIIYGSTTTLNTDVYVTEQLDITNNGDGSAVTIKQITNNNILSASNNDLSIFNIKHDGKVGINTDEPRVFLDINTKDGIKIPSGNTAERPAQNVLVAGIIRYNLETEQFEGYGSKDNWGTLGGVKDVDNDTYISAERFPGANNDELQFFTSNVRNMIVKKDGKVGIGSNIIDPNYLLDVYGDIRSASNLYVDFNIGIGTYNTDSLLNLYGNVANIKIQDPSNTISSTTSIELVNGNNTMIEGNELCGWKMANTNNKYIISSGSNNLISDRLTIDGQYGNVGVGTAPNHKLDVYGTMNANSYCINGRPFVLEFTQGMIVQTVHKTYRDTKAKEDNTTSWVAIDNDNLDTGFVIKIKPSHPTSKVLVSMSCHIGMDYAENSRWWGLKLYRKIGDGDWLPVDNANGSNAEWLEGSPCWISHNMGADNSLYSHSITNVSGTYEDSPETDEDVYYTVFWKSKLNNTFGKLYINRPATISSSYTSNYPLTSSSWTASEIWNNGIPYVPTDATISIAHNKVGIGTTPSQFSLYKLDVVGDIRANNIGQTSDYRFKKNIEDINNVLDNVNSLRPVSYLTLEQKSTDKKTYGFIAQELKDVFPNIVNEPSDDKDFYSINYISVIPLLVKSIQELNAKIEMMREEIDILKRK